VETLAPTLGSRVFTSGWLMFFPSLLVVYGYVFLLAAKQITRVREQVRYNKGKNSF